MIRLILTLALACLPLQAAVAEMAHKAEMQFVNVNEADAETLSQVLVGIGMSRARAIVEYRENYGRFYNVEELTAVRGIGQKTLDRNLARIRLE